MVDFAQKREWRAELRGEEEAPWQVWVPCRQNIKTSKAKKPYRKGLDSEIGDGKRGDHSHPTKGAVDGRAEKAGREKGALETGNVGSLNWPSREGK